MELKTIETLKIITNLILIVLLIFSLLVVYNYKQEVKEAIGGAEPSRLVALYENQTGTNCLCADPKYGQVVFIKNSNV
jgi:sensor histidine kinase regulating citrate/malate metabolism